jgi:hypothetical protein
MFHTVYCSFESKLNGRDYVGKHSSLDPYDSYLGSFKDDSFLPDSKIVLAYSKTPEGAIWLEMMFQRVFNVVEDPTFANRSYQTSTGFDTTGVSIPKSEEHRRKISEAISGEKHPRFGKPGTRLGATTSNETRRKISKTLQGRKRSEESRKKQACSVSGQNNPLFGKTGPEHPTFGLRWWFNPIMNVAAKFKDCPGPDWRRGRK